MTPATTIKPSGLSFFLGLLRRIATFCLVAFCIGWAVHQLEARLHKGNEPAGFVRGTLHGALMPIALPNLLVGNDVSIYAENNTGRTYKLGYTVGVNACGALFFGVSFFRLSRWRKRRAGEV